MTPDNQVTANANDSATNPDGQAAEHPPAPLPGADGGGQASRAPEHPAPKRRTAKGGAPALNGNALRHGLDSRPEVVAMRLELGTLPDSMKRVEGDVYAFRRLVENAVMEAKGSIGLIDAALIQTACRHERASRLALAWLRGHEGELSHAERLAYSKAIAEASERRDKAIAALRLERKPTDWWDDYYAGRTATPAAITDDGDGHHDQTFGHVAGDASNAAVDGHDGQRDNEHGTGDGGITP